MLFRSLLLTAWNTLSPYLSGGRVHRHGIEPSSGGPLGGAGPSTIEAQPNQLTVQELSLVADNLGQQIQTVKTDQSNRLVETARMDSLARQELQMMVADRLGRVEEKVETLDKSLLTGLNTLRETNANELDKIRKTNEVQLDQMRKTVDEKLQGTLEKRLGESFKLVSEQLEMVQRGLGEMQVLATDVGGLKRVLANVKNRGTWGEVQLGRQIEDVLAPGQIGRASCRERV